MLQQSLSSYFAENTKRMAATTSARSIAKQISNWPFSSGRTKKLESDFILQAEQQRSGNLFLYPTI